MAPPWTPDLTCAGDRWYEYDDAQQDLALDLAWSTLRHLTGGRVGHSAVTTRPCSPGCQASYQWIGVDFRDGAWTNFACALHGLHPCGCSSAAVLRLPGEVAQVDEVWLNGQVFTDWRLLGDGSMVRTDAGTWPLTQDLTQPPDGDSAFAVTYVPGIVPSSAGLAAAGMLAYEYVKACTGDKCRLPSSVTAIVRQGVSMDFAEGLFVNGVTGLREVDAYIMSVNPRHAHRPTTVWSPDITQHYPEAAAFEAES